MWRMIWMLAAFSLAACQSCGGPPLVTYTPAQQKQAAQELRALPAGSMVGVMIGDYGQERAAIRATQ